jgi:hypothetical protein
VSFVELKFIEQAIGKLFKKQLVLRAFYRKYQTFFKSSSSWTPQLLSLHLYRKIQINKPTRCNRFSCLLPDVYFQLMFGSSSRPSSELNCSNSLLFYRWNRGCSSAIGRGRAQPRRTALLAPRCKGKSRGCYSSCWALDDGREDARNMLSHT